MSNNRHSRSGHQVHPCWSGQARSSGARITKVALPLEKCLLVFIIDLQFLKASVGLRTFNQEGLQTNSLLREDLGLTRPMSSLQGEGLKPMPGRSNGPDGPVRTSGHRPVGHPAGRSGDVRAGRLPDPTSGRTCPASGRSLPLSSWCGCAASLICYLKSQLVSKISKPNSQQMSPMEHEVV